MAVRTGEPAGHRGAVAHAGRTCVADELRSPSVGPKRSGLGDRRLREAVELLVTLADEPPKLVIDHFGRMLSTMRAREAREILDVLRASRQHHRELDLTLVDHPGGPVATAVSDEAHPLYLAGRLIRFRRPTAERIVGDLAITRPMVDMQVELLRGGRARGRRA